MPCRKAVARPGFRLREPNRAYPPQGPAGDGSSGAAASIAAGMATDNSSIIGRRNMVSGSR